VNVEIEGDTFESGREFTAVRLIAQAAPESVSPTYPGQAQDRIRMLGGCRRAWAGIIALLRPTEDRFDPNGGNDVEVAARSGGHRA
jgi:hypothetical protein